MPGASEAHAAACAGWDPGVSTDQKPGQESKSIKVDWSGTAPAACTNAGADDWTGTDHYQIHRADGTTPPSTPSGATKVKEVDSAATSATDITHRSDKTFAYALFACMDSTCTRWYGDTGTESTTNNADDATTAVEEWELVGVAGSTYVGDNVVDVHKANAPHVFFYPDDWKSGYSGKSALYYSKSGDDSNASEVRYVFHDLDGWPSGGFNGSPQWGDDELVAEGSTDTENDDFAADHPIAMLTENSSDKRVQLFVQSQRAESCSRSGGRENARGATREESAGRRVNCVG